MLSCEGNENGENTTIRLISKKNNFTSAAHFFVHFFAVVLHDYNVKLPSRHTFYGGIKCPTCSFSLFAFNVALFILVAASISHFLTAATKFHVVPPTKKLSPLFFFSRSGSFSPALSLLASRPIFSFSLPLILFLYIPNLWAWQLM